MKPNHFRKWYNYKSASGNTTIISRRNVMHFEYVISRWLGYGPYKWEGRAAQDMQRK